ncbi:probable serine/threonine-protein kinase PBL23 isoform X1 [Lactuca sativa]|uniref:Protein kinase domain-containing protein n=1 Tax=Lactuca sativa TaxID=4236 RepID=A0A9R1VIU2_LACSA|nr:probable serine/threonine-protein kinase PBL23 isoform X1 [Lactuca sativa]KAJ0205478.1 hypothetical protein LSAT_V11C500246460 [Lactuca sativa]
MVWKEMVAKWKEMVMRWRETTLLGVSPILDELIMSSIGKEYDHLKIQMEDIISATDNFSPSKLIGRGGFGPVYKGELSLPTGSTMVAFKCLDHRSYQGNTEFWKEIMMLSKCKHENLVSLLHFCIEDDERVLVYEYAAGGSLDHYLSDAKTLKWNQRLCICIEVARALNYLHDPVETQQRVLHRDMKSSNILLDHNWTAKVSDFGLSKIGPANQPQTYLITNVVGTPGYTDPLYSETCLLTKESDVYSFGVVLFEVMCGRLCYDCSTSGELTAILVPEWKKYYDENKLHDIIFRDLKEQMVWDSFITFAAIARRCLERDRTERPTMDEILNELEVALEKQENTTFDDHLFKISKLAIPPLPYKSRKELVLRLSDGILVDGRKRWLWINEHKQINEMESATESFHTLDRVDTFTNISRFLYVRIMSTYSSYRYLVANVKTQFLSPNIAYTMNLVFKNLSRNENSQIYVPFKIKMEDDRLFRNSSVPRVREDGWATTELYQFINKNKENSFRIEFFLEGHRQESVRMYAIEGIEFRPV